MFRDDINVDWDSSPRIIEVENPETELLVQDLYDTLCYLRALPENMDNADPVSGSGKEYLGNNIYVGLTVTLLNAKIKFANKETPTLCVISGGNLVSINESGEPMNAIEPSANVSVQLSQSASATIITAGSGLSQEEHDAVIATNNNASIIPALL